MEFLINSNKDKCLIESHRSYYAHLNNCCAQGKRMKNTNNKNFEKKLNKIISISCACQIMSKQNFLNSFLNLYKMNPKKYALRCKISHRCVWYAQASSTYHN